MLGLRYTQRPGRSKGSGQRPIMTARLGMPKGYPALGKLVPLGSALVGFGRVGGAPFAHLLGNVAKLGQGHHARDFTPAQGR